MLKPKLPKLALLLLQIALVAYLGICLFMWAAQRSLLYHPQGALSPPEAYGLQGYTDITLKTQDGTHVHLWRHDARPGFPTLLYFHGNGGNLGHRAAYFRALSDAGFGLLALDYRGFGLSEGSASEAGFYLDARATLSYATQELRLPMGRLILYGESIGTGVAVQMATEYPVAALVLQSPYTSIEALATGQYPWLPVHFLLSDRFDSFSKIAHVHAPLLLFHGEKDTIVPVEQGKALFAHANTPKEAVYYPLLGHNDLAIPARTQAMLDFCRKYGFIRG